MQKNVSVTLGLFLLLISFTNAFGGGVAERPVPINTFCRSLSHVRQNWARANASCIKQGLTLPRALSFAEFARNSGAVYQKTRYPSMPLLPESPVDMELQENHLLLNLNPVLHSFDTLTPDVFVLFYYNSDLYSPHNFDGDIHYWTSDFLVDASDTPRGRRHHYSWSNLTGEFTAERSSRGVAVCCVTPYKQAVNVSGASGAGGSSFQR